LSGDNDTRELTIHPLVRDVGRQYVLRQPSSSLAEYFAVVASLLFNAMANMPNDRNPRQWPGWKALAPHVVSALRLADDANVYPRLVDQGWKQEDLLIPLTLARPFLYETGRYWELEEVSRILLRWQQRTSGFFAVEALATEVNLAYLRQHRGDHEGAIETYQKVAALLPQRHPLMTSVRHNLAALLRDCGELDSAEKHYLAVLPIRRREVGDDHEMTLSIRNALADIENRRGNYAAARRAYVPLLRRCLRVLRPKARLTLIVQDNLAVALKGTGDLDAAEEQSLAAVAGFTEIFGAEHPDTLVARSRLALLTAARGDLMSAVADLKTVVESLERALAPSHPITAEIRASLRKLQADLSRDLAALPPPADGRPGL
jgi:tetratricopeptide (TPR) repeat protein